MTVKRTLLLLSFVVAPLLLQAQYFNQYKLWQQTRNEVVVGLGVSNYLGELGGQDAVGKDFIYDLELASNKFSFSVQHRYFLTMSSAFSYGFTFGTITGDDQLTNQVHRRNRNIHFKSPVAEFAARYELHFLNESPGHLYKFKGIKGFGAKGYGAYVFGGIAGYYFNPKAKYNGSWVRLQPLGTEGQGLNGTDFYSLYQLSVPLGAGFRYRISRMVRIGVEVGWRKTFTDYLDDVSTTYYDSEELYESRGEAAEYLSNPTNDSFNYIYEMDDLGNTNPASTGYPRGDSKDLDSYMFLHLTGNFKIFHYSKFHRNKAPRGRYRYGGRYKPKAKF